VTAVAGKVAVVTGGASGIGWGIVEALIEAGAAGVVVADIEEGALETVRERATRDEGPVLETFRCDVADAESVEALKDFVLGRFGRVDIVCLNAGVGPSGRIRDLTPADWKWILGVNLWGVINGVTTFLPVLLANPDGGHIEVTGSNSSFVALPGIGSYNVTKYGVRGLVETLAVELEQDGANVHVTLLAPGFVATNIGRSSRNRPEGLDGALFDFDIRSIEDEVPGGMRFIEPITAGRIAVRSIEANDLYAPTHPDLWPQVDAWQQRVRAAYEKYPVMEDA